MPGLGKACLVIALVVVLATARKENLLAIHRLSQEFQESYAPSKLQAQLKLWRVWGQGTAPVSHPPGRAPQTTRDRMANAEASHAM